MKNLICSGCGTSTDEHGPNCPWVWHEEEPTPSVEPVDYEAEARIVFPDDMMPETDAPTINALRHGFVKARQMSVPTNDHIVESNKMVDHRGGLQELINWLDTSPEIQMDDIRAYRLIKQKATELLSQQKKMDGKVTRGNMLSEIVGSFPDLEYKKDAPIDPIKAREIAEKAIQWTEENYYITYNKSTSNSKKIFLDTHYPIEKEGDDKADNQ